MSLTRVNRQWFVFKLYRALVVLDPAWTDRELWIHWNATDHDMVKTGSRDIPGVHVTIPWKWHWRYRSYEYMERLIATTAKRLAAS